MNIELIKVDDRPIQRRVFMQDYEGIERRRNKQIKITFNQTKNCVLIVCVGGALALMLFYFA